MSTRKLLEKYHINAKKHLGQNFLTDLNLVKKMVTLSGISSDDEVIEIGPGLGILTGELLKKANKVTAFEIDQKLWTILKEEYRDQSKLEVILADFLTVDLSDHFTDDDRPLTVCANLPYYITTPILFKLFNETLNIEKIVVMMQKEVALRFCATPKTKDYGALTVISEYKYHSKIILNIPKEAFTPRPKVDSAVVMFVKKTEREAIDEKDFFALVKSCFKYRRKTIYNNYKELLNEKSAKDNLSAAGIDPHQRAEELNLGQYLQLFKVHNEKKSLR